MRAAAKNFRGVLVVVDPADYARLLAALDEGPSLGFRFDLMRKALAHTAAYDTAITPDAGRSHGERRSEFERCSVRSRWAPAPRSPSRRFAICDTAKTPTSEPPGTRLAQPSIRVRAGRRQHSAGQGAFVYQPSRPRCRGAHRARVRRAGRRGHQAHESVRRRDRDVGGRRLRACAQCGQPVGLRRHRRAEPRARRGRRRSDRLHVHRSRHRPVGRRGRAADSGEEGEHARRGGRLRQRCVPAASSSAASSERCSRRSATSWPRRVVPGSRARCPTA